MKGKEESLHCPMTSNNKTDLTSYIRCCLNSFSPYLLPFPLFWSGRGERSPPPYHHHSHTSCCTTSQWHWSRHRTEPDAVKQV